MNDSDGRNDDDDELEVRRDRPAIIMARSCGVKLGSSTEARVQRPSSAASVAGSSMA